MKHKHFVAWERTEEKVDAPELPNKQRNSQEMVKLLAAPPFNITFHVFQMPRRTDWAKDLPTTNDSTVLYVWCRNGNVMCKQHGISREAVRRWSTIERGLSIMMECVSIYVAYGGDLEKGLRRDAFRTEENIQHTLVRDAGWWADIVETYKWVDDNFTIAETAYIRNAWLYCSNTWEFEV